jgi:hypothetical protein
MTLSAREWVDVAFCVATAVIQAVIFVVVSKRKLRPDFPIFLAYLALLATSNLFLTTVFVRGGSGSDLYFYSYWVLSIVVMLLEFGVMAELLTNALKPYSGLIDLGKMLFRWAALFLLLVACITAFATSGSAAVKCEAGVRIFERSLRLMQCGLLLLFFLFERRLALSWRSSSVSVAIGLGTTAAVGISLSFVNTHFPAWVPVFDFVSNASSLGIAVFWLTCFARPEPARKNVMDSPSKVIFQRWNEALLATAAQDKNPALASVDSFLPGIEKTVDRVLARKIAN